MKRIKSCKFFIIPTLGIFALSGFFLLVFNRSDIHFFTNAYHSEWADSFFKSITHFGDGLVFILALPLLIIKNLRWFFITALTAVLVLFVTGILKQWVFHGLPRPVLFFGEENLYLVPGVKMHSINSFPSGHTTAAFAFYFILCFLLDNKLGSFLLFILASLVGYSRIYLSQHFLIDVLVGAILGIICGYFAVVIIGSWKWNKLDLNLYQLLKRNA